MTDFVEQQREHFNEISKRYAEARKHPNHLLLKDLMWSEFFKNVEFSAPTGMKVLEPMCGMSEGLQIIKRYVQKDIEYSGFDYSDQMVKIARRENPQSCIELRDATSYDSGTENFDWIILIGGLHHVFAKAAIVVQRLALALSKGGYFLNFEPTHNCLLTRRARALVYNKNTLFDQETEKGFELKNLDLIFEQAGFEKIKQMYPGLLSYILYYNPDAFPLLNIGGTAFIHSVFAIDKVFWRTWLAKKLSFATITLWRRK
ncbi:class I SAM-dependent methyltransferase [uncultured Desulfobulbus sp.]|uniref:class I SAM-dependent methyltransferase n=1 Tax=uncultured Desulfobulbus sp. TaxID=239745 RepID=UPI0029C6382C|nr:class I SAM-dependent methyltransferase [uncultured Desulfobulbus sp.]